MFYLYFSKVVLVLFLSNVQSLFVMVRAPSVSANSGIKKSKSSDADISFNKKGRIFFENHGRSQIQTNPKLIRGSTLANSKVDTKFNAAFQLIQDPSMYQNFSLLFL